MGKRPRPPTMPGRRSNGGGSLIIGGFAKESPMAPLADAILDLAKPGLSPPERTARVQRSFEILKAFEASFVEVSRRLGCSDRALLEVTEGEFFNFQTSAMIPAGSKIRVVDAEDRECVLVDVQTGRFIRPPGMAEPLAVIVTTPDGKDHRIIPGQPVTFGVGEPPKEPVDSDGHRFEHTCSGDDPLAGDGEIGECSACGVIACPYDEPLHFHHDGCPSCIGAEEEAQGLES